MREVSLRRVEVLLQVMLQDLAPLLLGPSLPAAAPAEPEAASTWMMLQLEMPRSVLDKGSKNRLSEEQVTGTFCCLHVAVGAGPLGEADSGAPPSSHLTHLTPELPTELHH